MLDAVERAKWFEAFLAEAIVFPEARRSPRKTTAWARSMALIAEQFADNDERDYQEIEV